MLSNEDESWIDRCFCKIFSGVVGDEIDFDRWTNGLEVVVTWAPEFGFIADNGKGKQLFVGDDGRDVGGL